MENHLKQKGILLIAHGSPREKSNLEFVEFTHLIQKEHQAFFVQPAFLECSEPSIPNAIDLLMSKACKEIIVIPYFLGNGKHTTKDIPEIISKKNREYPEVDFKFEKPIGLHPLIKSIIEDIIKNY